MAILSTFWGKLNKSLRDLAGKALRREASEGGPREMTSIDISRACNLTAAELDSARDAEVAWYLKARKAEVQAEPPIAVPDTAPPTNLGPMTMYNISTACDMTAGELYVARDAELAHEIAQKDDENDIASSDGIQCHICFDMVSMVDSFSSAKCSHSFCKMCIRRHLEEVATETHQYPLICPQCRAENRGNATELDTQDCLAVMVGTAAHSSLECFLVERQHLKDKRYCANPVCSTPFDWEGDPSARGQEFMVFCPSCGMDTCVKCNVLWHVDRTCEQYANAMDGTDALVELAKKKEWMACPKCKMMIDRREGDCFFVSCRCGCGFCHKCGKQYRSLKGTGNNSHGLPNCTCGLFPNL